MPGTWKIGEAGRFWQKVNKTETCWLWTASSAHGYGVFRARGHNLRAHRWSYEQVKGPIPEGLQIDHLCRVKLCVNPDHLEAVTAQVNVLRSGNPPSVNARKTHCPRGHEFTEDNLYRDPKGGRYCLICKRRKGLEVWQRRFARMTPEDKEAFLKHQRETRRARVARKRATS